MQWNASLFDSLINTLAVSFGAAVFAVFWSTLLAIIVGWYRTPFATIFAGCISCLVLVPVYVQATAWSAGFGIQGWWQLSQVDAAKSQLRALMSVVWIHGAASVPVCFLLALVGLIRARNRHCERALQEFGSLYALRTVVLPTMLPWLAGGMIWTICTVSSDMVVTNLFQFPTITESVYQQVQFNKLRSLPIVCGILFAVLLGLIVGLFAMRGRASIGTESTQSTPLAIETSHTGIRVLLFAVALVIVSAVTVVPLMSLVAKMGWNPSLEDGGIRRSWSASIAMHSLGYVTSYNAEVYWSLSLSAYSSLIAVAAAIVLLQCDRNRWTSSLIMGGLGVLLAMPGPLVNLFVLWVFDRNEPDWMPYLADQTLAAPLLALQTRCLPLAFAVLWIARRRYEMKYERMLKLESTSWFWREWNWVRSAIGPMVVAAMIAFFLAFSDLSSYLLVQPPQVTTVAMRMFDLLHYGIRNRESAFAFVLAIATAIPSIWLVRRLTRSAT